MKRLHDLLCTAALCVALGSPASAAEHMIRFTTEPTPVGLIHWWAEEKGIFAKNGLKYTDTIVSTAYIGLQGIGAGTNDAASMNEAPIVNYLAKGVDAIVVANLAQTKAVYKMVAPVSIADVEQLKGKKVTWMGGTGAEYAMIRFLQAKKMGPKDFDFVNLAPAEELPAVMNNSAVAMWSWEPWPRKLLTANPGKYHVIGTSSVDTYEGNMITTVRRKFAHEDPEAVRLYLRSLTESVQQIKANEGEAIDLYARKLRTTREEAKQALHDYTIGVWLDDRVVKTLLEVSDYIAHSGRIEKQPDWKKVIDTSYLRAVDPASVKDLTALK